MIIGNIFIANNAPFNTGPGRGEGEVPLMDRTRCVSAEMPAEDVVVFGGGGEDGG